MGGQPLSLVVLSLFLLLAALLVHLEQQRRLQMRVEGVLVALQLLVGR
jgi:hypothetical protein